MESPAREFNPVSPGNNICTQSLKGGILCLLCSTFIRRPEDEPVDRGIELNLTINIQSNFSQA